MSSTVTTFLNSPLGLLLFILMFLFMVFMALLTVFAVVGLVGREIYRFAQKRFKNV
jgi:hypothetical protein